MTDLIFRSDVTVTEINNMASDASVLMAAKVSTLGEGSKDSEQDESTFGFINYLMRNRHGSPFEHAVFTFYVEAPIFVWREHMRHRIASYNEESGRYKVLEPVFYVTNSDRNIVQTGKPGHYEFIPGTLLQLDMVEHEVRFASTVAYSSYTKMLRAGVSREVARMVLPLNIYSSAYVTMNARSLMNFLSLRTKSDYSDYPSFPQREIEMVAELYENIFREAMPLTYEAFCVNGRVAP